MRVVYFVTSQPGIQCGVVDYTQQLAQAVRQQGDDAVADVLPQWSFGMLKQLRGRYGRDSIVHLQYPTLGMGKSPAPALLPFFFEARRTFITLHEFEQFSLIRKLYFLPASLTRTRFVFTNEYEMNVFTRYFPWAKKHCAIVPIGNNIDIHAAPAADTMPRIVYFGQIARDKGIETFLEIVRLLREQGNKVPCAIIGSLLNPDSPIASYVKNAAGQLDIELKFSLPAEAVSHELLASTIAILPFPHGVGDKRGSALACLKHGLALVTIHGPKTPAWWRETTYHAAIPREAAVLVKEILAGGKPRCPNPARLVETLGEREWSRIAHRHQTLYEASAEG